MVLSDKTIQTIANDPLMWQLACDCMLIAKEGGFNIFMAMRLVIGEMPDWSEHKRLDLMVRLHIWFAQNRHRHPFDVNMPEDHILEAWKNET